MSYETTVASIKAMLTEPMRSRLRRDAEYKRISGWPEAMPDCWAGAPGHVVVKVPTDTDPSTAHRVTYTGYVCLDCGVAFGGGLGLMDFSKEIAL